MMRWLAAVLLLALVAPAAAAEPPKPGIYNPTEPSTTTLYFHPVGGFLQEIPINTQMPQDQYSIDSIGLNTDTTSCLSQSNGDQLDHEFHTAYGYSSAGYVEYNVTEGTLPRISPERPLPYDVKLEGETVLLTWYLEPTAAHYTTPSPLPVKPEEAIILPGVSVHAWMRSGEEISLDNPAFKTGTLYAEGETVGNLGGLVPGATTVTQSTTPDGKVTQIPWKNLHGQDTVLYEFVVPMKISNNVIAKQAGFNMQVAVTLKNDACKDPANKGLMPNLMEMHTDKDHRPRMDVSLRDAIRCEYIHPQHIGDDIVVHVSLQSAWGNYDVDETVVPGTDGTQGGVAITIDGPSPTTGLHRATIVQRLHEHFYHTSPVEISYAWPYKSATAKEGLYSVVVDAFNDQHTAKTTCIAQFEIGRHGDPGPIIDCDQAEDGGAVADCRQPPSTSDGKAFTIPGLPALGLAVALLGLAARRRNPLA